MPSLGRLVRHSNRSHHALVEVPDASVIAVSGPVSGSGSATSATAAATATAAAVSSSPIIAASGAGTTVVTDSSTRASIPTATASNNKPPTSRSIISSTDAFHSSQSSFVDPAQNNPNSATVAVAAATGAGSPLSRPPIYQQPQQAQHQVYGASPNAVGLDFGFNGRRQSESTIPSEHHSSIVDRPQNHRYSYAAPLSSQLQQYQILPEENQEIASTSLENIATITGYNPTIQSTPPSPLPAPGKEKKSARKRIKDIFSGSSRIGDQEKDQNGSPGRNGPGSHPEKRSSLTPKKLNKRLSNPSGNPSVSNTRPSQPVHLSSENSWQSSGHQSVDTSPLQDVTESEEYHHRSIDFEREAYPQDSQASFHSSSIRGVSVDAETPTYDGAIYHSQHAGLAPEVVSVSGSGNSGSGNGSGPHHLLHHHQQDELQQVPLQAQAQSQAQAQALSQHLTLQQQQHNPPLNPLQHQLSSGLAPPQSSHQTQPHVHPQLQHQHQLDQALPIPSRYDQQSLLYDQQSLHTHPNNQTHLQQPHYSYITTEHIQYQQGNDPRSETGHRGAASHHQPHQLHQLHHNSDSLPQVLSREPAATTDSDQPSVHHQSTQASPVADYCPQAYSITPNSSLKSVQLLTSYTQTPVMAPPAGGPLRNVREADPAQTSQGTTPSYRHSNSSTTVLATMQQGQGGGQSSSFGPGEQGRQSPQPEGVEGEKQFKDLLAKYKNVKRLYFDGKSQLEKLNSQVEQLQNAVANQRMSQSRTALDDSEYMNRFGRLNGAVNNLAFNIRKDWRSLPTWLSRFVSPDGLRTGKQEMTAVGRAVISKWLVDEVFDKIFHPGLDPLMSLQLKNIERGIRDNAYTMTSQEEYDALTTKIVNWRMATLDGLQGTLQSSSNEENRHATIKQATSGLTALLHKHLNSPPPPEVEGSAGMIVELAIGLAANLPLESRDVAVTYPLPGDIIRPNLMEIEKLDLPAIEGKESDSSDHPEKDTDKTKNDVTGGKEAQSGMCSDIDETPSPPSRKMSISDNKVLNTIDTGIDTDTENEAAVPGDVKRVRFAGFVALEVKGRQVLMKAPVWTF